MFSDENLGPMAKKLTENRMVMENGETFLEYSEIKIIKDILTELGNLMKSEGTEFLEELDSYTGFLIKNSI